MTFKDHLATDLANVFFNDSEFAESITYAGTEILAVPQDASSISTSVPGVDVPTMAILVREADVAQPKAGDTVIVHGRTWHVEPGAVLDGAVWALQLTRQIKRVGV